MKLFRVAGVMVSGLLPFVVLAAGVFSDVSDKSPFKGEIESLVRAGVVHGNPDGKFYPDRNVNRAEFLKMLYLASGRAPKAIYGGCFPDIERGSWYELFVCDAAAKENRFVQGYPDGSFKPAAPVTRTEALKMLFTVLGLSAPDITTEDREIIKFVDISVAAWYSKYISAAYLNGVLPIAGHDGARFYPDRELGRGEAAAYIWNGLRALDKQRAEAAKKSSSADTKSADADLYVVKEVKFPFTDSDQFKGKRPTSYIFIISGKTVAWAHVTITGTTASQVTCRLYLLDAQGFSSEYYLGYQQGSECSIRATLRPGKYQFQVQPTVADTAFSVETKVDTGDGNDGFVEAVPVAYDSARSGVLEPNDLYDWYSFTVDKEQKATVEISSTSPVECIVYTPDSVDQFGFTGPQCNVPYDYVPPSDGAPYVIGIGRRGDPSQRVTYTVKWR